MTETLVKIGLPVVFLLNDPVRENDHDAMRAIGEAWQAWGAALDRLSGQFATAADVMAEERAYRLLLLAGVTVNPIVARLITCVRKEVSARLASAAGAMN